MKLFLCIVIPITFYFWSQLSTFSVICCVWKMFFDKSLKRYPCKTFSIRASQMCLQFIDLQKNNYFSPLTTRLWDSSTLRVSYFLVYCVLLITDNNPNNLSNNFHVCSWRHTADRIHGLRGMTRVTEIRARKRQMWWVSRAGRPVLVTDVRAVPLSAEENGSMKGWKTPERDRAREVQGHPTSSHLHATEMQLWHLLNKPRRWIYSRNTTSFASCSVKANRGCYCLN